MSHVPAVRPLSRREFIKLSVAAATASAVGFPIPESWAVVLEIAVRHVVHVKVAGGVQRVEVVISVVPPASTRTAARSQAAVRLGA